ncbi:MAG TPA: S-methyl-5'-thioadenosine phosphorylase [Candidatus Norongarragalinales archaeon]|jgi:5'-methylthioadenosine phosphorylase|nr:S-methyl-5'-thioadenosine phosphorylase [Candidatus Norongarragalinales archaeon]
MKAEIAIIGGSGFYSLFDRAKEVEIDTPYGAPSDKISLASIAGRKIAFLARHGKGHRFPPHKIPYRANVYALKSLGVKRIIAPAAVGSLQKEVKPGDFVISDQFVDRTTTRAHTFYDEKPVTHVSMANPYCSELRGVALKSARVLKIPVRDGGTCVVVEGPRFSTRAESEWFSRNGWSVINMTQYPEAALARELEMCYVNVSLVTDYDAGMIGNVAPVTAEEVGRVFAQNNERVKKLIARMIPEIPRAIKKCDCGSALRHARL